MKKNSGNNLKDILEQFGDGKIPHDGPNCPQCDEPWDTRPNLNCICNKPMLICIPPGGHIHIQCPVHGDVKIYGPRHTLTSQQMVWSHYGESTIKVKM